MTDMLSVLLRTNGFDVLVANSASDGIAAAASTHVDIVILDQVLPVMMGWEVCESIRNFSAVPILMLSVVNKPEVIARALDAGADDYLVKPVSSSVLISHLNTLTRRSHAEIVATSVSSSQLEASQG